MLQIPLTPVPTQRVAVNVDGQAAQIEVRQNGPDMFFSLWRDDEPIVLARICRNVQLLLIDARYRGFRGEFIFTDLEGETDPVYTGLGSRYVLTYLPESEVP